MHIEHIDIKSAYLHDKFAHNGGETVYVRQHARFNGTYKHDCQGGKLDMNIYGTPSARHTYLSAVFALLRKDNFKQSEADLCLWSKIGKDLTIAALSMENFTVFATTAKLKDDFAEALAKVYNIKRLGSTVPS